MQLPSWITPHTKDAYNWAYTFLYCKQPEEVREDIDRVKKDNGFSNRFTVNFFSEVIRIAEYEMSYDDKKAAERREKAENRHPSQQKKIELPKPAIEEKETKLEIPPTSGENPS